MTNFVGINTGKINHSTSFLSILGYFGFFIHARRPIQGIREYAILDKNMFIHYMQNCGLFTHLMVGGLEHKLS